MKRLISLLLILAMCLSMVPFVFADNNNMDITVIFENKIKKDTTETVEGHVFLNGIECGEARFKMENGKKTIEAHYINDSETQFFFVHVSARITISDTTQRLDLTIPNTGKTKSPIPVQIDGSWPSKYKINEGDGTITIKKIDNKYKDIKRGSWYYVPVMFAIKEGITKGKTDTQFAPSEVCSRSQVVTFIYRMKGSPAVGSSSSSFKDLSPQAYYYKPVLWANAKKITAGITATEFAPGANCTRGQVVTFLWRAQGAPNPKSTKTDFTDVNQSAYYAKAVAWAVENGITTGISPTKFEPDRPCTRAEVVTFIFRIMDPRLAKIV